MTGDCHVRFCESGRGRFPPATHQFRTLGSVRGAARKGGPYRKRSSSAPEVIWEAGLPITVMSGKWQLVERKSAGVVVAVMGRTTQPPGAKGPYFIDA